MKEHVGFNPPELCERCEKYYQYRNGLCFDCWVDDQEGRDEERHDCEVIKRQERREIMKKESSSAWIEKQRNLFLGVKND